MKQIRNYPRTFFACSSRPFSSERWIFAKNESSRIVAMIERNSDWFSRKSSKLVFIHLLKKRTMRSRFSGNWKNCDFSSWITVGSPLKMRRREDKIRERETNEEIDNSARSFKKYFKYIFPKKCEKIGKMNVHLRNSSSISSSGLMNIRNVRMNARRNWRSIFEGSFLLWSERRSVSCERGSVSDCANNGFDLIINQSKKYIKIQRQNNIKKKQRNTYHSIHRRGRDLPLPLPLEIGKTHQISHFPHTTHPWRHLARRHHR